MPRIAPITAIDLGTDKCVTLIAVQDETTRQLRIVGAAAVNSRGMRKSTIVDLEQVLETITESLDAAERMAGFEVKSAYVGVGGPQISSQNSKGVVAVATPNQEIIREDVSRVIEAARAISLPADREIIHVIPKNFKVDSQDGIKDPVGMTGVRLESEAHIITAMTTALRNIEKCIHDVGLSVDGFVFSGLASSEVILSETEKELGVVAVDIGAGSTSICAFVEGSIAYSASLPIGARHITQDLALGCRISLDSAEKIKMALSGDDLTGVTPIPGESKEELNKRRKKADQLDISSLHIEEQVDVLSKKALVEGIMVPRMKEILTMVGQHLTNHQLMDLVPAGLVLTGGGAETVGMVEVAKRVLNLPARVGKPTELQGMIADINKPSYAAAIGLIEYGRRQGGTKSSGASVSLKGMFSNVKPQGLVTKISELIRSLMP